MALRGTHTHALTHTHTHGGMQIAYKRTGAEWRVIDGSREGGVKEDREWRSPRIGVWRSPRIGALERGISSTGRLSRH